MNKIEYQRDHDLGYFHIHNPDYHCIGMMNNTLAVYRYQEEDNYIQYDVVDVTRSYPDNISFLQRVFEFEIEESFCDAWIVTMSRVDEKYKGFGLAPKLYAWLLMKEQYVLQAGDDQSPGGRKIWHSLAKEKDVLVYGRSYKTDLVRCEPCDFEDEIVVDEAGIKTYDGHEYFTAFACYSPERRLKRG